MKIYNKLSALSKKPENSQPRGKATAPGGSRASKGKGKGFSGIVSIQLGMMKKHKLQKDKFADLVHTMIEFNEKEKLKFYINEIVYDFSNKIDLIIDQNREMQIYLQETLLSNKSDFIQIVSNFFTYCVEQFVEIQKQQEY